MSQEPIQKQHEIDWRILHRLREGFLEGKPIEEDYWQSEAELRVYDRTFAQRIAWKWEAVLRDLKRRGWEPSALRILDWGCGTGIASRMFFKAFPPLPHTKIQYFDRSKYAMRYAGNRLRDAHPDVQQGPVDEPDLLLVSHVLGELNGTGEMELERVLRRASALIWVEPGDRATSARLVDFRERLMGAFQPVAPCTHSGVCGMLAPENARHWCHFFAHAPTEIHSDPFWSNFSREMNIDLRSIPYSYLVMVRQEANQDLYGTDWRRIIGRPRLYKGYAKVLTCGAEGVADLQMLQRNNRELYKAFDKGRYDSLQQVTIEGGKMTRSGD